MEAAEEQIKTVVHNFYERVRQDGLLGPVFERAIGDDWDIHLRKMCDFWQTILVQTGGYKGNPMMVHLAVPDLNPQHFDRWLELFVETVQQVCDTSMAEFLIDRANRMRWGLQRGIAQMQEVLAQ